jgi:putative DNA primase/helicase
MVDEAAVDKIIAGLKSERKTRKPLIEPLPDPDKLARLPRPDGLDHARAADFDVRAIAWMWPGRFAIGKLGLIGGMPDMGKGVISAFIAAAVTASVDLPCGEGKTPQGNVLWFTGRTPCARWCAR